VSETDSSFTKLLFSRVYPPICIARITIFTGVFLVIEHTISDYIINDLRLLYGEILQIIPQMLTLIIGWNTGINFGLFDSYGKYLNLFIPVITVLISAFLLYLSCVRSSATQHIAISLVIAGAMGNAINRIVYGAVPDFINFTCCGFVNPYIFNIADIYIFIGCVTLIFGKDDNCVKRL